MLGEQEHSIRCVGFLDSEHISNQHNICSAQLDRCCSKSENAEHAQPGAKKNTRACLRSVNTKPSDHINQYADRGALNILRLRLCTNYN